MFYPRGMKFGQGFVLELMNVSKHRLQKETRGAGGTSLTQKKTQRVM